MNRIKRRWKGRAAALLLSSFFLFLPGLEAWAQASAQAQAGPPVARLIRGPEALRGLPFFGPNVLPAAMIVLISPEGKRTTAEAAGSSSTDAICQAITEATGIRIFLKDFNFSMISSGANALGQASITAEYHNRQVRTKACSIDMLEAAAKAYLMAINIVLDRIDRQLE